ncbi:Hypothetical protein SMAX5B_003185 [Scophthalmus maximus]|uniref:Ig-like domain-containing protein n=1 Tax=Scophthalmus maximus TaxID=52904 RepID=A0A2U9CX28_SCOMX|nr:uncharacterized protein LOC118291674 isoform X2 [Scophthalmus maximus]AWP21178.1 Hypothetical protein SMAX5B_003185 [Scophthalmus maximus]
MDLLSWIVSLLCVAGCRWSSASPVLRLDHVVRPGQNVTLACELASDEVTWYQLRSDRQMLPLLTVTIDKLNQSIVSFHAVNNVRLRCDDSEVTGPLSLEILEAEPEDSGTYFCSGRCEGVECFSRGILVSVEGSDGMSRPCWSGGICVFPASLVLVFILVFVFLLILVFVVCLCSGRCPSLLQSEAREQAPPPWPPTGAIGQRGRDVLDSDRSLKPERIT